MAISNANMTNGRDTMDANECRHPDREIPRGFGDRLIPARFRRRIEDEVCTMLGRGEFGGVEVVEGTDETQLHTNCGRLKLSVCPNAADGRCAIVVNRVCAEEAFENLVFCIEWKNRCFLFAKKKSFGTKRKFGAYRSVSITYNI